MILKFNLFIIEWISWVRFLWWKFLYGLRGHISRKHELSFIFTSPLLTRGLFEDSVAAVPGPFRTVCQREQCRLLHQTDDRRQQAAWISPVSAPSTSRWHILWQRFKVVFYFKAYVRKPNSNLKTESDGIGFPVTYMLFRVCLLLCSHLCPLGALLVHRLGPPVSVGSSASGNLDQASRSFSMSGATVLLPPRL